MPSAEDAIEGLLDAGVLEHIGDDRYRFHDLIRLFAIQKLAEEEPAANVDVAKSRLVTWLLRTATHAGSYFEIDDELAARLRQDAGHAGSFDDIHQAGAWLADELPNWLDAMRTAAAAGRHAAGTRARRGDALVLGRPQPAGLLDRGVPARRGRGEGSRSGCCRGEDTQPPRLGARRVRGRAERRRRRTRLGVGHRS